MGPLLALALAAAAADPSVVVEGAPLHAQIEGESDVFARVEPGFDLVLRVNGPGKLVLDLRGYAHHMEPVVAPLLEVELDGARVAVPPIAKPANRAVAVPTGGFASNSTLLELTLAAGAHRVQIRAGEKGTPALVASTFIAPDTDLDFLPTAPRRKPAPAPAPEIAAAPSEVHAAPVAEVDTYSGARRPVALEVTGGVATHLQMGGSAPIFSFGADLQLGPSRALAIGVEFDYLRLPLLIDAPLPAPEGQATLHGTLASIPLLAHATYRFLDGGVQPFAGIGAGVTLATLTLDGSGQSSVALPTAEAHLGLGVEVGPGEVVLQARLLASQGDFPGVAKSFQGGGVGGQAGYRFEL